MKPKELLSKLSHIEALLNEFSFENLSSVEAITLKRSYEFFKSQLQDTIDRKKISSTTLPKISRSSLAGDTSKAKSEARLIAKLSHEMSTHLNGIISITDLLKEDGLNDTQLKHLNTIKTEAISLLDYSNELLEYSKLSTGQESFKSVQFNFNRLICDVVFLGNTLIVKKNLRLQMNLDSKIPDMLIGDPTRLSQVLLNLLSNVIKYVDEGEIVLRTTLQKSKSKTLLLEFEITHKGPGISARHFTVVLDSSAHTNQENTDSHSSTGLRHSILKEIVLQLGGDISIRSNLGEVTSYKLLLPFIHGDKTKLRENSSETSYLAESARLIKGAKILVFEDSQLNQHLITTNFLKNGAVSYLCQ